MQLRESMPRYLARPDGQAVAGGRTGTATRPRHAGQARGGGGKGGRSLVDERGKEERRGLKTARAPVHVKMADRVGKDMLQSIYKGVLE